MRNSLVPIVVCVLISQAMETSAAEVAAAKPTWRLQSSRQPGQIDRVTVVLEVDGKVIGGLDDPDDREPLAVECRLTYDEKTLRTLSDADAKALSIRHYEQTAAKLTVGRTTLEPTLRPERCLVGVQVDRRNVTLFSPHGPLTRKELELVEVLGNSLLLDRFLPQEAVAIGDRWKHSEPLMAALLDLEAIAETDVQSVVTEVTDKAARMEMSGHVEGAVDGVSTEIDIKAKYRFDRRTRRIDWFAMLVSEDRGASRIGDGWNAKALLQMQISPETESEYLTEAALKGLVLEPDDALEQLKYTSADGKWQLIYDRPWHVCRDREDLVILRWLDRGEFIAQCNIFTLPNTLPDKQVPLAEFQSDLQRALGDDFGEFVEAGQQVNEAGYLVYRVVVAGSVGDLPFQWNYYYVRDQQGRRVTFAFTVEGKLASQLGNADRRLINSLRFTDPKKADPKGNGNAQGKSATQK